MTEWEIKGKGFTTCNCAYGCPCQFNARPTHGDCSAVVGYEIEKGRHGGTPLDGLRAALVARWPGAIHEGRGEALCVIDERADDAQRAALLRIFSGEDTDPGATIWQVFSATFEKMHDPIFAPIDLVSDVDARRARLVVPGLIEARGEPILNPVTGAEHRARIDLPDGFEYTLAEMGRGWSKVTGAMSLDLADTYGQFARLHLTGHGVVK